jgi:hypothetical protein
MLARAAAKLPAAPAPSARTASAPIAANQAAASKLIQRGGGSERNTCSRYLIELSLFDSTMSPSDDLSHLLQNWQPEVASARDFNHDVWSRIEASESSKNIMGEQIAEFFSIFARPRIAVTATMIALFAGVFLGGIQARSAQEEQYLQSLNPYGYHSHTR